MKNNNPLKKVRIDELLTFEPMTKNQKLAYDGWKEEGNHLIMTGSAGTGKTFTALYLALESMLDKSTPWDNIKIIRSVVPTREIGFLPGTLEEKIDPYIAPYRAICSELFDRDEAYNSLVKWGQVEFCSTSFVRGTTFDNSIIIVDEVQNLTFHELDSVITRVGLDTRIIFSGDYRQSDFKSQSDKDGIIKFLSIVEYMKDFSIINFGWDDIVRSSFVRDYIMTKEMFEDNKLS
jgi:phosphate starvation-inducible PhoH-like protein